MTSPDRLPFYKYQGTGNDFILIEDADGAWEFRLNRPLIAAMCDRRFGIGADGLMLLQKTGGYDFRMVYYNADGGESSFCGNGSRCLVALAHRLGWIGREAWFVASDGDHEARIDADGRVAVHMRSVKEVTAREGGDWVLDTGSPHYVRFVPDAEGADLVRLARAIRYSAAYREEGINVNLVTSGEAGLQMRTYERGVEDETLSCGTGVTAAVVSWAAQNRWTGRHEVRVHTRGGELQVGLEGGSYGFRDIWLQGPAEAVFEGVWPWRG